METHSDLREVVKGYVDSADERLLRMLNAVIEAYYEPISSQDEDKYALHESAVAYEKPFDYDAFELTEERKKMLDERLKFHEENPDAGITWEQLKAELTKKYGTSANR